MVMKPNYGQQRAERNRAKQAKAEQKQREKAELAAKRKATPPEDADRGEAGDD